MKAKLFTSKPHIKAAGSMETGSINYISVLVTSDDTLWSIADRYYSDEFGTVKDYIKEIKRCNVLKSDNIYAGRHIIVPVIYGKKGKEKEDKKDKEGKEKESKEGKGKEKEKGSR